MFLVIAGKMDYNLVLNYIKENQSKKSFTPTEGIKRLDFKEPKGEFFISYKNRTIGFYKIKDERLEAIAYLNEN